jgi:SPRY domain
MSANPKFDEQKKAAGLCIDDDGTRVTCVDDDESDWPTVLASETWHSGVHSAHFRLDKAGANLYVGLASDDHNLTLVIGETARSWSLYTSDGDVCNRMESKRYAPANDARFPANNGDVVSVHADLDRRTVEFAINGSALGIAFDNVEPPVRAAVTLALDNLSVSLLEKV